MPLRRFASGLRAARGKRKVPAVMAEIHQKTGLSVSRPWLYKQENPARATIPTADQLLALGSVYGGAGRLLDLIAADFGLTAEVGPKDAIPQLAGGETGEVVDLTTMPGGRREIFLMLAKIFTALAEEESEAG